MRVSLYSRFNNPIPESTRDLFKVLRDIKDGVYVAQIKKVRSLIGNKEAKDIEKKKLKQIGFGGIFSSRANDKLISFSGFACLDYDGVTDLIGLKEKINSDAYTFSSWISPSGNGLKVLVKLPKLDNNKDYQSFYIQLTEHYKQYGELDLGTKDISRATYYSYDPDLFLNTESVMWTDRFIAPEVKPYKMPDFVVDEEDVVIENLIKWFKNHWTTGKDRNSNLFKLASAFNDYGVDKYKANSYLLNYASQDFREDEIQKITDSAYKNVSSFGTKFFEDKKKEQKVHALVASGRVKSAIEINDSIDIDETFIPNDFWSFKDSGAIVIDYVLFERYLHNFGLHKYYISDNSSEFEYIIKDGYFMKRSDQNRIKDMVKEDLLDQGQNVVWSALAGMARIFTKDCLSILPTIDIEDNRDEKDKATLYYQDFALNIYKNKIDKITYSELNKSVWCDQVIKRNVELNDKSEGEFKTFIWKVSGEDPERYYSLKSAIGYLMHSHQSGSKPKAIIWNDETVSDDVPNGRSGKGLINKAISQIKNYVTLDGKNFDPNKSFLYQQVTKDTQVLLYDDVKKNFDFESLFSVVTEGLTVERKNKDSYKIPFKDSPKISITTNYTIRGEGSSHDARVFEVELSNYFNDQYTPEDEFGHLLFDGWDDIEWQKFDNYMIRCIQYFLKNGLVESKKVNLEYRKLKQDLGVEFIEWMETEPMKERISRKDARQKFENEYPKIARYNTPQKFNKKVKNYCDYHGLELTESKYNGVDMYKIEKDGYLDKLEECDF